MTPKTLDRKPYNPKPVLLMLVVVVLLLALAISESKAYLEIATHRALGS